ncbi:S ribonuclease [Pyrus ussuriensis x Pyrus communis]|uniref:S ribonuclease n=1 Tax=Pyrus ussuriensis x Pyrus communis TaxID=2448454 RepID=A0A5N5HEG2_9ROSA|nr:S ribonuclease [Pyrus ussuriensis x Pyrus communis]
MKPPHRTNSLPIVQNQLSKQALACDQPMVALLIDNIVRYPGIVNQYSSGINSDTGHRLISGSDSLMPRHWFTVLG